MAYAELNAAEVAALAQKAVESWTAKDTKNPSAENRNGLTVAKRVLALANLAQSMASGPKTVTLTDVDCLSLIDETVADAAKPSDGMRVGFVGG